MFNAIGMLSYAQKNLEEFSSSYLRGALKVLLRSSSTDDVEKKMSNVAVKEMSEKFSDLSQDDQDKMLKTMKVLSVLPQDYEDEQLDEILKENGIQKEDFQKIIEEVDSSSLPSTMNSDVEVFIWKKLHDNLKK
ncbi:hypothetical protein [Holospora undulata]|uniref:Uncharacterized protein n=1 Tax=Holospora undulata HU1 TaxID=1321371 RepID=A0A061JHY2_9PROT|nr:hypothetical protein [Holospora undulata]ETZ05117.1 hypothetical protein K737_300468 [Holospora undulata HU1]